MKEQIEEYRTQQRLLFLEKKKKEEANKNPSLWLYNQNLKHNSNTQFLLQSINERLPALLSELLNESATDNVNTTTPTSHAQSLFFTPVTVVPNNDPDLDSRSSVSTIDQNNNVECEEIDENSSVIIDNIDSDETEMTTFINNTKM